MKGIGSLWINPHYNLQDLLDLSHLRREAQQSS
eukprot:SAG31_NODE_24312_length_484_cov_1.101299_1_plen_32_part_10